jgi:hypothetical protein
MKAASLLSQSVWQGWVPRVGGSRSLRGGASGRGVGHPLSCTRLRAHRYSVHTHGRGVAVFTTIGTALQGLGLKKREASEWQHKIKWTPIPPARSVAVSSASLASANHGPCRRATCILLRWLLTFTLFQVNGGVPVLDPKSPTPTEAFGACFMYVVVILRAVAAAAAHSQSLL